MNWASWLLWAFVATLVLTTIMAGSQGLRLTRMNISDGARGGGLPGSLLPA